jgi:uncharacterized DUF497 family protein
VEIKKIRFDGFDWDSGNILKVQKHGVAIDSVEEFFSRELFVLEDQIHSKNERRHIAVGITSENRNMFVVFTLRKRSKLLLIRPISARYTHKKETELYEKLKKRL